MILYKVNKFQSGGIIYVTDPKDPKLKAYNDSLKLYNESDKSQKFYKDYKYEIKDYDKMKPNDFGLNPSNPSGFYGIPYKKITPIETLHIENDKNVGDFYIPLYKKPVQPIILKKEEKIKADYLKSKKLDFKIDNELMAQKQQAQIKAPEYTTEIVTSNGNYTVKKYKDSKGKVVKEEYYDLNGKKIEPIK